MTQPANIRINLGAPFPATVRGSGAIAVAKKNGVWTVSLNFSAFPISQNIPDPLNAYILTWDSVSGVFLLVPAASVASLAKITKVLNGAGAYASPYAALASDDVLIVKQGAANPFTVTVDWSQRTKPLRVVAGDTAANFADITITPKAGQK